MSKAAAQNHGYGRYKDDPEHVGCPRAKSDMTPCIARDGATALDDGYYRHESYCVGCGVTPAALLREHGEEPPENDREAADRLRDSVRSLTA